MSRHRPVGWLVLALSMILIVPSPSFAGTPRPIPYTIRSSLRTVIAITGSQLDDFIRSRHPSSPLVGLGHTWVRMGQEYNINAIYLMAHAIHESNWGTTRLARRKHNIYGWQAFNTCSYGCAQTFKSLDECVMKVVPLIDQMYLNPGGRYYTRFGPTLQGINVHYATDKHWKYSILDLMNQAAAFTQAA